MVQEYNAQAVANTLWAYAKMEVEPGRELLAAAKAGWNARPPRRLSPAAAVSALLGPLTILRCGRAGRQRYGAQRALPQKRTVFI